MKEERIDERLKPGTKVFVISGDIGNIHPGEIIGDCEEGGGYVASCPSLSQHFTGEDKGGNIHTCNLEFCGSRKEAKIKSKQIALKYRKRLAEKQSQITRTIQYIDWSIRHKGYIQY